jgi:uncharacterized protein (DUF58 family)
MNAFTIHNSNFTIVMLSPDLIEKARLLEIRSRQLVQERFAGEYHSAFKGQGMVFDEVRPYSPGDEIRSINWHVTARTGEPYVKRYEEEHEQTVMLVVDVSGSTDVGSRQRSRRELAAEIAAVFALAANYNHDKVGLLLATNQIELHIKPSKGRKHIRHCLHQLLHFSPQGQGTDLSLALHTTGRLLKQRGIVFLVSDFLAETASYQEALFRLAWRHDVIALELSDPLEQQIANVGLIQFTDAETGQTILIDSRDTNWRVGYGRRVQQWQQAKTNLFQQAGIDHLAMTTGDDYLALLVAFFRQRQQRRSHR